MNRLSLARRVGHGRFAFAGVGAAAAALLLGGLMLRAAPPAPAARPGETIEKHDDGSMKARYRTDPKGEKNGAYEEFFPSGKAQVRGTYTSGVKTGLWTTFDEAGKTVETATYGKKGTLDGPYTWTAANGKAGFKATYKAGEIVGQVTVYDDKAKVSRVVNYPRPLFEIRQAWDTLYPKEMKPPKFLEEPSAEAPYKAGKLAPETLEEALKVTKLYRYLSGVPFQQLALDPQDNEKSQHGAVLLKKIGSLTHGPSKPADMDDAFFKLGFAGCAESNLHQGQHHIVSGIRGFMDDSDDSNVAGIGHRRWVLKPGLKKVGFGFCGGFTAMHVLGGMGDAPNFDFVMFPGDGYYPKQLVEKHYAWSAHFNSAKVKVPPAGELKVTVTPLDEHYQPGEEIAAKVVSVIVDAGQGWHVIVFKPDFKALGVGRYWVDIAGIRSNRGGPAPFGYVVDLFDVKAAESAEAK